VRCLLNRGEGDWLDRALVAFRMAVHPSLTLEVASWFLLAALLVLPTFMSSVGPAAFGTLQIKEEGKEEKGQLQHIPTRQAARV
jgi:hypothetical protein